MKKDFRDELLIKGREDRYFQPIIETRNYLLSTQASDVHYCEPRRVLDDIRSYKTWDIAIMNKKNEWVNIKYDEVDKEIFSKWKLYDEFVERYEGILAVYVETETVQSLYDFLKDIDSNKI